MTDRETLETLKQFAALLAAAPEADRNAYISRVKLMAMQEAAPEAFEAPVTTLGDYLLTPIPVPPVLVAPALVVRGGLLCTIGRAGKGKTQMNLNRIMRWACGRPMFDELKDRDGEHLLKPPEPLKTLIIENEGAAGMFHRQVGIMLNSGKFSDGEIAMVKENVLIWGDGGWSGLKLDDQAQLDNVRAGVEKWQPDVVFIEPFRGLWKGEENSATDMANIADALSGVAADYDCGVIITHHERKSGVGDDGEKMSAGRGSTVLEGVVATMENFEVAKGGDFRELSWSKVRYGGGHPILPVRMEWQPGEGWYRHVAPDEREHEVLLELANSDPEPLSIKELRELTQEKDHTLRRVLADLTDAGKIVRLSGTSGPDGNTGMRYRLKSQEEGGEGLGF